MSMLRLRDHVTQTLVVLTLCLSLPLYAESAGLYYGASATLQQAEVLYQKTVVSRVGASDVLDSSIDTETEEDDHPLQWDGLVGYRFNFAQGTQFIALQGEISIAGDAIQGTLPGNGESPEKNRFGEAWPESWNLETSRSVGVIVKYGIHRALFGTFNISLYGLAGTRQSKIDFLSTFHGCFQKLDCSVDQLRSDSQTLNPSIKVMMAGVGFETGLTKKTSLQFEFRYTEDMEHDWLSEFEDDDTSVTVPAGFTVESSDLAIKLIRYL